MIINCYSHSFDDVIFINISGLPFNGIWKINKVKRKKAVTSNSKHAISVVALAERMKCMTLNTIILG